MYEKIHFTNLFDQSTPGDIWKISTAYLDLTIVFDIIPYSSAGHINSYGITEEFVKLSIKSLEGPTPDYTYQ